MCLWQSKVDSLRFCESGGKSVSLGSLVIKVQSLSVFVTTLVLRIPMSMQIIKLLVFTDLGRSHVDRN